MKTNSEILAFIEERQTNWFWRPWLYASTPSALEEIMSVFEELRDFILAGSKDNADDDSMGYGAFLEKTKDVGNLDYITTRMQRDGVTDSMTLFAEFRDVWREYLGSPYRRRAE